MHQGPLSSPGCCPEWAISKRQGRALPVLLHPAFWALLVCPTGWGARSVGQPGTPCLVGKLARSWAFHVPSAFSSQFCLGGGEHRHGRALPNQPNQKIEQVKQGRGVFPFCNCVERGHCKSRLLLKREQRGSSEQEEAGKSWPKPCAPSRAVFAAQAFPAARPCNSSCPMAGGKMKAQGRAGTSTGETSPRRRDCPDTAQVPSVATSSPLPACPPQPGREQGVHGGGGNPMASQAEVG